MLFSRIAEGNEFELEVGGQKLRINMLEQGIKHLATSAETKEEGEAPFKATQLEKQLELLKELSKLPPLEVRLLAKFYGTDKIARQELKSKYLEPQISLNKQGYIFFGADGTHVELTEKGQQALEWIAGK